MSEKIQYIEDPSTGERIKHVSMPDGRTLAIQDRGDMGGVPIIGFHGNPGSRLGPWPRPLFLHAIGARLISFDRPGYGLSPRNKGRTIADTAKDVEVLADTLGIEKFCVNARSGGVPHALGCAALMPDRVANAAIMVGIAPALELATWRRGMTEDNVKKYELAETDEEALYRDVMQHVEAVRKSSWGLLNFLEPSLLPPDKDVVGFQRGLLRGEVGKAQAEGLRGEGYGWLVDMVVFLRPWGFDVKDAQAFTYIWIGEHDPFVSMEHGEWYSDTLPNSQLWVQPNASHFSNLTVLANVLAWQAENYREQKTTPE